MIFYGRKASRIKDGQINNVTCPNCEDLTSMNYSIFGKYAHIYWIPTFPMGRENISECNACKQTFLVNELPEQIKQKFSREKEGVKTPIWHFSGLAIIALLIAMIFWFASQNDAENEEFIQTPQIGDVYSIESENKGYYSSMKVTEVTNDSVHLIVNDYEVDKRSGIYKIDLDKNYTIQAYSLSKVDLFNLYKSEVIYEIDRE